MEVAKRINDVIHGYIDLTEIAVKVIDTPEFYRLRHLKQLGVVSHVFPGADHTRWAHSVGVYHLARMWALMLGANVITAELIGLGGLLHDVGHGPLSHTFEKYTGQSHEEISVMIVDRIFERIGILSAEQVAFVKKVITGGDEWQMNLVHSAQGVDVDRIDYLLRDSYYTNKTFKFEYYQLFLHSRVVDGVITYDSRQVFNIETLYRMRHYMFENVYLHPAVVSIEMMVLDLMKSVGFPVPTSLEQYLALDDADIMKLIRSGHPLGVRIVTRQIYHDVGCDVYGEFSGDFRLYEVSTPAVKMAIPTDSGTVRVKVPAVKIHRVYDTRARASTDPKFSTLRDPGTPSVSLFSSVSSAEISAASSATSSAATSDDESCDCRHDPMCQKPNRPYLRSHERDSLTLSPDYEPFVSHANPECAAILTDEAAYALAESMTGDECV